MFRTFTARMCLLGNHTEHIAVDLHRKALPPRLGVELGSRLHQVIFVPSFVNLNHVARL